MEIRMKMLMKNKLGEWTISRGETVADVETETETETAMRE